MSKEALPAVQSPVTEREYNHSEIVDYIDTDNFEIDKEKKALIEKVMKNSNEIEAIGILAKDLNHNIEVYLIDINL